jgi:dihydrofolate synthase / folylpolyglutamate synthase
MVSKVASRTPFQTYPELLSFLDNLDVSVMKLGTQRVKKVLAALGNPQDHIKTIHVVGTNGKGSVCAMLSSVYTAAGYQTGLFISPHLISVRERIQRQGQPVDEETFLLAAREVYVGMTQALPDRHDWLTYFEYISVMAFWLFSHHRVDVAIIETGLGGRLDATNVITRPQVVVVTPISIDHVDRLGYTLAEIASEKAGVFKANVPVLTCKQAPEVMKVLSDKATRKHARLHRVNASHLKLGSLLYENSHVYRIINNQRAKVSYTTNLLGRYQYQNLSLVMQVVHHLRTVLPVTPEALNQGLKTIAWPGRFQYLPERNLIIDGSHNPAGFDSLLDTLIHDFTDTPIHWGISLLSNRPLTSILPMVGYKHTHAVHFLAQPDNPRFHPADSFADIPFNIGQDVTITYDQSPAQFCNLAVAPGELKILTGSLYTAGWVLKYLATL